MPPPLPVANGNEKIGLIYRFNTGYQFRIGGSDAKNDGILAQMDIGYQSGIFLEHFSIETGSSVDFFGETEHLAAYFQFNYHYQPRWIFSLRLTGGGIEDEKEKTPSSTLPVSSQKPEDKQDGGGLFDVSMLGSYSLGQNFQVGLRVGFNIQAYGNGPEDQGTQYSLSLLSHLAYLF